LWSSDEKKYKSGVRKLLQLNLDPSDSKYIFKLNEALIKRISGNKSVVQIYSDIVHGMARFQIDSTVGVPKWLLVDKVVRQLCGNKKTITFDYNKQFSVKKLLKDIPTSESIQQDTKDLEASRDLSHLVLKLNILADEKQKSEEIREKKKTKILALKEELKIKEETLSNLEAELQEIKEEMPQENNADIEIQELAFKNEHLLESLTKAQATILSLEEQLQLEKENNSNDQLKFQSEITDLK